MSTVLKEEVKLSQCHEGECSEFFPKFKGGLWTSSVDTEDRDLQGRIFNSSNGQVVVQTADKISYWSVHHLWDII